jgi:hypothetical protein
MRGHRYFDGLRRGDRVWQSVMEKLDELPSLRERSLSEALHTLRWRLRTTAEERQLAADFLEGFNAARLDRASVKAIVRQTRASEAIEGDRIARIPRGYDTVVRRLGRGLRIERGTRIDRVRWSRSGVQVFAGNRSWEAARAIVTVPLGVLQANAISFEPALPRWKQSAVKALAMGPVVKIALLFAERHWPADMAFLHARGQAVPTFWRPLPSRAPALIGWAASRNANALREKNAAAIAVRSLSAALGERVRPVQAICFEWQTDELSRGAYSWVPTGALPAQRALARTVGTLHFAGEATHFEGACGTVHGALETGMRAAREILEIHRKLPPRARRP